MDGPPHEGTLDIDTRQHVFIAIPTTGLVVTNEIAALCEAALMLNSKPECGWRFTVRRMNGMNGVAYARNRLVQEFLASDADKLWFFDQDVRPSANSFELLLMNSFDIAAGVYPAFNRNSEGEPTLTFGVYHRASESGLWSVDPLPEGGNPIIPCDAVMMGATTIKRHVLEDARMCLGEEDGLKALFQTPRSVTGRMLSTEDTDFCARARELGYTVGCHSWVKWGHLKQLDLLTVADLMIRAFRKGMAKETS